MKKNRSRILAGLLACLVACDVSFTLLPVNVLATEPETADVEKDVEKAESGKADASKEDAAKADDAKVQAAKCQ